MFRPTSTGSVIATICLKMAEVLLCNLRWLLPCRAVHRHFGGHVLKQKKGTQNVFSPQPRSDSLGNYYKRLKQHNLSKVFSKLFSTRINAALINNVKEILQPTITVSYPTPFVTTMFPSGWPPKRSGTKHVSPPPPRVSPCNLLWFVKPNVTHELMACLNKGAEYLNNYNILGMKLYWSTTNLTLLFCVDCWENTFVFWINLSSEWRLPAGDANHVLSGKLRSLAGGRNL